MHKPRSGRGPGQIPDGNRRLGELSKPSNRHRSEVERALAEELSAEQFAENIQAAINDSRRLTEAKAELVSKNMEAASSVQN